MKSMQKYNIQNILDSNNISDISIHTDNLQKGSAFCATKYVKEYIDLAIKKGASSIISEVEIPDLPDNIRHILVDDIRHFVKEACLILYQKKPKYMVGVTGTSGKTSIVDYYRQICGNQGIKSASIGTMGILCSDANLEKELQSKYNMNLTSADIVTFHQILNQLALNKVDHVAFEVSSHALDQDRISGIKLDSAIFSNLSQDHLDYHKDMLEYKRAKLKIFTDYLKDDGLAITSSVLFADRDVKNVLKHHETLIISNQKDADMLITNSSCALTDQEIKFIYKDKEYSTKVGIIGSFQSMNILMALAASIKTNNNLAIDILPEILPVKGRLERVTDSRHKFQIFNDYAHKPEALKSCLMELRLLCKNRLIVLFGCGGNRDASKRPIMGKIAADYADIAIVTDDNPRFEDPGKVRSEIIKAVPNAIELDNRANAIREAIAILEDGDILLIAGKGHEDYQIIGNKKIHLDDSEEVRKYI